MKDIAREAGASIAAVSRVLNQDESFSVSMETRRRILQAAQELKYEIPASKLTDGSSLGAVMLLMLYREEDELKDPYYLTIRTSARKECSALGGDVVEHFHLADSEPVFPLHSCSAVVVIGSLGFWTKSVEQALKDSGKPVVFVDFNPDVPGTDSVLTDFHTMMDSVIEHLLNLGYRQIGYIGGREYNIETLKPLKDARERFLEENLMSKSLYYPDSVYINRGVTYANGYELAKRMMADKNIPEAVFIENDTMAIGAMKAFAEGGIRIPEHLAVVGCNDIPAAEYISPSLSTMRIHTELMGQMAVRIARERSRCARNTGIRITVPNEMIIRESCGGG